MGGLANEEFEAPCAIRSLKNSEFLRVLPNLFSSRLDLGTDDALDNVATSLRHKVEYSAINRPREAINARAGAEGWRGCELLNAQTGR